VAPNHASKVTNDRELATVANHHVRVRPSGPERGTPKDIEITTIRAGLLIFLVPHQGLLKIFMVKYQILIYYICTRIYQGG
jgi:hypothetical protein